MGVVAMNERERIIRIIVEHPELAEKIQEILYQAMQRTRPADPLEAVS